MRVTALEVFDEIISGTGNTWYTPAHLNETLGLPDAYAVQACVSQVGVATGPTLTVTGLMSGDGNNWVTIGSAGTTGTLTNDASYFWSTDGVLPGHLALVRFAVTLGVTSGVPSCRLKVYFTGRSRSAGRGAALPTGPAMSR